ncbi:MAG: ABC transporter permease [Spirochaetae bacterium HGW-Spirochaetae-2]|nr:MAG: ABC transporter permease [Spirochaetae bacterium HGW-Spirochaetae-2]
METLNMQKDGIGKQPAIRRIKGKLAGLPAISYALGMLVLFIAIFAVGSATFLTRYNMLTIGNSAAILLAVAMGQVFAILTGGIDLSVGGIMSLVSVVLMKTLEPLGFWAYPLSLAVGIAAGFLNGLVNSRLRIPSFITTLGSNGIFMSIAYMISIKPLSAPSSSFGVLDIVNGTTLGIRNIMLLGVLVFVLFFVIQRYTITGRNIMLLGSNEKMSWLSGVDIFKVRTIAFTLSGLGAALAGVMLASNLYSGYPTLGTVYILNSIASVVIGGTAMTGGAGGVLNTLVGVMVMSVINNGMNIIGIDVYAQQSFLGVLVIIAVAISFDRSKLSVIK